MHIYYDETTAKYNYALYLESGNPTQARCDYMRTVLNSAELKHVYDPDNPGDNKQDEGDEGGNGDFNNEDDPVEVPPLPSINLTSPGGLNLYKLTDKPVFELNDNIKVKYLTKNIKPNKEEFKNAIKHEYSMYNNIYD